LGTPDTGTLVGFTLQQGIAVAVCVAVAVVFAVAIVMLFKQNGKERESAAGALKQAHDDCREERKDDRAEWMRTMDKHTDAIDRIAARVDDLTRRGAA
jgi:mannitol-specific phosphotransferase system IIBC component